MEEECAVSDPVTDGRAVGVAEGDGVSGKVTSVGRRRLRRTSRLQGLVVDVKAVLGQCLNDLLPEMQNLIGSMIRSVVHYIEVCTVRIV